MEIKKILKIILIICLILIAIDQTSKLLINKFVDDDINLLNNKLTITMVENKGIIFGVNKQNLVNIVLTVIILIAIFNYIIKQKDNLNKKTVIFLSFILAGGTSNLIDRIFRGAVFDYIKIGNFPVFNLADCFIVIGWVLFVITFVKSSVKEIKEIKESLKADKK